MPRISSKLAGLLAVLAWTVSAFAQPTLSKVFTPNTIGPGSVSTITFTITNGSPTPVTGLSFTDMLPAVPGSLLIADPANASTDCDLGVSGSFSAPDGDSTIALMDAQLAGFQSCTVSVDVTASTPGTYTNPAVTLDSNAGSSMSLAVDLTVNTNRPGFSKSFSPSTVPRGNRSTLTFTIDNSANASAVGAIAFSDVLPAGLEIAGPANASTTCDDFSAPALIASPGTNGISLGGGSLFAASVCTVTVDVVATGVGLLDNVTGTLTSTSMGPTLTSGKASDTLEATITPLALTKAFIDDPVPPGGTATLEFAISNLDRNFSAVAIAFTDDLTALVPALPGLTFDSLLSNDCGTPVTGEGTTTISLSGGSLAPEASCTIQVILSIPVSASPVSHTNTTSAITGTVDGSPVVGNMASDVLFVESVPVLTKEFLEVGTLLPNPVINAGEDVVMRFTITNTSSATGATNITFIDQMTNSGGSGGFLPFPTLVALPPTPNPPCGAGSSLMLNLVDTESQALFLSGGTLAAAPGPGDSCSFDVTLTVPVGVAPGVKVNTTGEVSATVEGDTRAGNAASAAFTVIAAPDLVKEFTDDPVAPGAIVTLQFTLSYPAEASGDATGISFTDDLTTVLTGLAASGLPLAQACDPDGPGGNPGTGTLSGTTLLTFTGGTLSPGESCTFSATLDVPPGATPGTFSNTTSDVSAAVEAMAATSAPASADLIVSGLRFSKEFVGDPLIAGSPVTLRFTIENVHPTDDATITQFADNLSSTLSGLVTTGAPTMDTCGGSLGGTATNLNYTGGGVLSGQTCVIEVPLLVPMGAADGVYSNTTGLLIGNQGGLVLIDPATDTLVVDSSLLQLTKSFTDDPVAPGDSVTLEFTLTNLDNTQAASMIGFTDDLGSALSGLTFDGTLLDACGGSVMGTGTDTIAVSSVSLAAGGSCTLRVSLSVPGGAAAGAYINSTSAVSGMIGGLAVSGDPAGDQLDVLQLLVFSKSFDGPAAATSTAILSFTIANPGSNTATDIAFTSDLDAVITGLIATGLPALPCGAASSLTGISLLTLTGGELPPMGGSCTFDVEVLVPPDATAGTFPSTTSDLFSAGLKVADPASADLVVEPPPTFAKVFSLDAILAGGTSTLQFAIDNSASAVTASNLAFTDNLPAGVVVATPAMTSNTCGGMLTATAGSGAITLAGGSVGAGASCTIQVSVTAALDGTYVNTSGALTSTSGSSGTANDTLTVNPVADISVTKSDGVAAATPGGATTYAIVVSNAGPSTDPSVSLADAFPGIVSCTFTSLASGGATGNTAMGSGNLAETLSMPSGSSVTYTVLCSIDSGATGMLSNTADVSGSVTDPASGNDSATDVDTLVPAADVSVTKTDGRTSAVPGQTMLEYTIVASNGGPSDDPSVSLTDMFPAGLTCLYISTPMGGATGNTSASGNLSETLSMPAGSMVTYLASCSIDPSATGTLSNTATISGSFDPASGNNTATDDDTVLTPETDLSLAKSDGGATVVPGTNFTYSLTVINNGPSDSSGGTITDVLPSGLSFVSSADGCTEMGGTVTCPVPALAKDDNTVLTFVVMVDAGQMMGIVNSASVAGNETDPNAANDTGSDGTPLAGAEADFSLTKDDGVLAVEPGSNLTYSLTVTNNGPSDSVGGTVTDVLPAGLSFVSSVSGCIEAAGTVTCTVPPLTVGADATLTFVVLVDAGVTAEFTNTATVAAAEIDPNAANDSDSHLTPLLPVFSKSFAPLAIVQGEVATLSFVIDNTANSVPASNLAFTDNLPAGMTVAADPQASSTCGGTVTAAPGAAAISFAGGMAAASSSCSIMVQVTANMAGPLLNTATLGSSLGSSGAAPAEATLTVNMPAIPLLNGWGLLVMAALIGLLALRRLLS